MAALKSSVSKVTESSFNETADYICSIVLELVSSGNNMCSLTSLLIESYATALVVDAPANLWAIRAIDEIVNDIQIMQKEKDVAIRLLSKLIMMTTRDISRQKSSLGITNVTNANKHLLPTDLIVDHASGLIHLIQSLHDARDTYDSEPPELRDAILRTLLTSLVNNNYEDAQTLLTIVMTRCGRTKDSYDQIHKYAMTNTNDDDDMRIWMPLGFTVSNQEQSNNRKKKSSTTPDTAWGIWRTLYKYTNDDDARDFVARLASLYAYKWTPARRHLNTNILMHALSVVMERCSISHDVFEPDFMDLVQVTEIRMVQQLSSSS